MFEPIDAATAARWLLFSGAAAILWSSVLGLFMMIPHLRNAALTKATRGVNFRQLLSAHLDWIMLAFMQALAAGLLFAFDLAIPLWVVAALIFGGWMNAVPYFLRAFGINAFVFAGGVVQRTAAGLGAISVAAVIAGWSVLVWSAAKLLFG